MGQSWMTLSTNSSTGCLYFSSTIYGLKNISGARNLSGPTETLNGALVRESTPSMYLSYFFFSFSFDMRLSKFWNSANRSPDQTTYENFSLIFLAMRLTSSTGQRSFLSLIESAMNLVILLPASGICLMQLLITNPSTTGMIWVTPSPESSTVPVQLTSLSIPEEEIRAKTACTPMYSPFTLKVQNMISAMFYLFYGGLRGGSVRTTTVSWGSQRRQSNRLRCQNFSIRSQFLTIPPSIGLTTLCVLYMSLASSPMEKSNVSVIFLLLSVHAALELWSPESVISVGISNEGSVLPAQPILVYPVPLSMTTMLLLKFIRYLYCCVGGQRMSKNKVTFKVILASEIDQPFKVISVPDEAPFSAVIRYVCDEFRVDEKTTSILTMDGVGINPDQTCGDVFLKFGSDVKMIPRDRVGAC